MFLLLSLLCLCWVFCVPLLSLLWKLLSLLCLFSPFSSISKCSFCWVFCDSLLSLFSQFSNCKQHSFGLTPQQMASWYPQKSTNLKSFMNKIELNEIKETFNYNQQFHFKTKVSNVHVMAIWLSNYANCSVNVKLSRTWNI